MSERPTLSPEEIAGMSDAELGALVLPPGGKTLEEVKASFTEAGVWRGKSSLSDLAGLGASWRESGRPVPKPDGLS